MRVSTGPERDGGRNWGMVAFVAALALVLFGVGVLVGRGLSPEREGARVAPDSLTDEAGPRDIVDGVPVGYARSEEGAIAATTNFARVMSGPVDSPESYRQAMRMVAAPRWQSRAEELATNAIQFVNERYGSDGTVVFVPVRYRVSAYSDREATIDLWGSALGSGSEVEGIEQSWVIATLEVEWIDDDWKVVGQSSRAGPTPTMLDMPPGMNNETLRGFQEYGYGPRP